MQAQRQSPVPLSEATARTRSSRCSRTKSSRLRRPSVAGEAERHLGRKKGKLRCPQNLARLPRSTASTPRCCCRRVARPPHCEPCSKPKPSAVPTSSASPTPSRRCVQRTVKNNACSTQCSLLPQSEVALMKSSTIDIQKRIHAAAETTIARMADADAALGEALANNAGLSVAINSSFLFRDKRSVKTFQSRRRLAAKASRIGKQIRAEDVSILDESALKKHYRILSEQELGGLIPLQDAVSQEINSVGDLIFVLAGTVKG